MNPTIETQRDWYRYYSDTYMLWRGSPTLINVVGDDLLRQKSNGQWVPVIPDDLKVWWPRPGAYRMEAAGVGAMFIGRRPLRTMKKSTTRQHYYVQWPVLAVFTRQSIISGLQHPTPSMSLEEAVEELMQTKVPVALNANFILAHIAGHVRVVYKAREIGRLEGNELVISSLPHPIVKRGERKFYEETL